MAKRRTYALAFILSQQLTCCTCHMPSSLVCHSLTSTFQMHHDWQLPTSAGWYTKWQRSHDTLTFLSGHVCQLERLYAGPCIHVIVLGATWMNHTSCSKLQCLLLELMCGAFFSMNRLEWRLFLLPATAYEQADPAGCSHPDQICAHDIMLLGTCAAMLLCCCFRLPMRVLVIASMPALGLLGSCKAAMHLGDLRCESRQLAVLILAHGPQPAETLGKLVLLRVEGIDCRCTP